MQKNQLLRQLLVFFNSSERLESYGNTWTLYPVFCNRLILLSHLRPDKQSNLLSMQFSKKENLFQTIIPSCRHLALQFCVVSVSIKLCKFTLPWGRIRLGALMFPKQVKIFPAFYANRRLLHCLQDLHPKSIIASFAHCHRLNYTSVGYCLWNSLPLSSSLSVCYPYHVSG
jgi:hypothetical protein